MKTVTNTSKTSDMTLLAMAMFPGGIEAMEAHGQSELVNSEVLPTIGLFRLRQMIEDAGGKIGSMVEGDDMFTEVTLPEGWKKKGTDHDMWSELFDDKGHKRASMFYKAAFYDRSAHISGNPRFRVITDSSHGQVMSRVHDEMGLVQFSTGTRTLQKGEKEYKLYEEMEEMTKYWLNDHFPEWQCFQSYWDGGK